jgi:hypothetical protein
LYFLLCLDKEGNTKYNTEVIGEELTILSRVETSDKTATPYNSSGTPNLPTDMPGLSSSSDDDSPF